jgi:Ras-related protein Rab-18
MFDHIFKICVFGDYQTGKTSFLNLLHNNNNVENPGATIGIDYSSKIMNITDDIKVKITFWDCSGQERFNCVTDGFFRDMTAGILFFDVCNSKSYKNVLNWVTKFRKFNDENIPILLVGNKIDRDDRCISKNDAYILANDFNLIYTEISVIKNININNAIDLLIDTIYQNKDKNPNIKNVQNDESTFLIKKTINFCDPCIIC